MRIVFTLGGTDAGRSGLGSYVRAVLPELARVAEHNGSELLALGSRDEIDAYGPVLDGVFTLHSPSWTAAPGPSALWYLTAVGKIAARANADVILYSAANRRFSAYVPLPSVAVVHDLGPLYVPDKYDALRLAYFRYGLLPVLRRASCLVAISNATRADLVRATGVDAERVEVVPNGVDTSRFIPRPQDDPELQKVRSWLNLPVPYLLYPARLELPGKNHLRLLEAFASSQVARTHRLVLVGADWGGQRAILESIAAHRLQERVQLVGYVSEDFIPPLVGGADAVLQVGLREGFGLPALEALAAGRPVCAASTGALPEVVGDLGASCDPYSVESIRAALDRVVFDDMLRARCASEGPERAAARTWKHTAQGLYRACRLAVASRSKKPSLLEEEAAE